MGRFSGLLAASLWLRVHLQAAADVPGHRREQRPERAVQEAPDEFRAAGL